MGLRMMKSRACVSLIRIGDGFDGRHLASQIRKANRFDRKRTNGGSRERFVRNRIIKGGRCADRKHAEQTQRDQIGARDTASAHLRQTSRTSEVDDAFAKAPQFFTDNKLRGHLEAMKLGRRRFLTTIFRGCAKPSWYFSLVTQCCLYVKKEFAFWTKPFQTSVASCLSLILCRSVQYRSVCCECVAAVE